MSKKIPKTLTPARRKAYLKSPGSCPFCGEDVSLEGGSIEVNCDECWQDVDCLLCGAGWTDTYKLAGVEVRMPPD